MDKNNLLLVLIGFLFVALFGSYMYKTGQLDFLDNHQERQQDWRQDQDWRNQQMPPDWQNQPPRQTPPPRFNPPPRQQPPDRDPLSYPDAVKLSQQTGKNMLLFFSADWCSHCRVMKTSTLEDPRVKQALKNYIYYQVNTDKERSIASKYGVRSLPSYHIVNSQERSIKQGQGRVSSSEFIRWMEGGQSQPRRRPQQRPG